MSVKRIPGQDARFGTLYVNASDYDRLAISHQSALDDCKARCTERDALSADNLRLRAALSAAKYRIEQGRVWDGMGWTLTGLHPLGQQKALDAIDDVLSSGKGVGDE